MKKIIKYIIAGLLIAPVITISSCKKDINEQNKINPNAFSDSDPALMITGAQLANVMANEGEAARLACIFAGHLTGYDRQFISYGLYSMNAGDFDGPWGTIYADGIAQCRLVKAKAIAANNKVLEGVAQITEANLLLTTSSLWGDIPNSQACNDNILTPKFDKMSDVYNYCISILEAAAANVGSSSAYSAAYSGSFTWKEVANTLIARAKLHKKDYAGAIAAASAGVSDGNDFKANHATASPGAWNLYYDFLDWNRAGYISCDGSYIVNMLDSGTSASKRDAKTDETARFDYYFLKDNYTPIDPNMYGGVFDAQADFPLCSYVENELILAECYARTSNDTSALQHLNNVRASHEANFGGYQAYDASDFATNSALILNILKEKYVSLFGQVEVYNDVRRTGNVIGVPANAGTVLPGRFLHPQSERNTNPNTPAAGTLFDKLELFQ